MSSQDDHLNFTLLKAQDEGDEGRPHVKNKMVVTCYEALNGDIQVTLCILNLLIFMQSGNFYASFSNRSLLVMNINLIFEPVPN